MRGQGPRPTGLPEAFPCMAEGTERRAMCQALQAWLEVMERTGSLPAPAEMHPSTLPEQAHHLFLVDLLRVPGHCTIVEVGPAVVEFCGRPALDRFACDVFPAPLDEQVPHLCDAVKGYGKPVPHSGTAFAGPGEVAYRAVFMPLSGDGRQIDHVLGSITFRPV